MKRSFLLILLCVILVFTNTLADTLILRLALGAVAVLLVIDIILRIRGYRNER